MQLFWIVSRANNCQYCQGHQEGKLLRAGQKEDQIAALDGDWSEFTEAQKVAFAFARKFTYEPYKFCDADIDGLRKHYKDAQILEMILSMAGNNAINRWKEGTGVPQSASGGGFGGRAEATDPPAKHTYLTPTSDKYKSLVTKVAPVALDAKGEPTKATVCRRPALEARDDVEQALAAAGKRAPRLPLAEDEKARELLPTDHQKGTVPQWVRLLATFPSSKGRIASQFASDEKGDLKPLLKAQVSWIIARQDRAWYATGEAKRRLIAVGQTDDQIYQARRRLEGLHRAGARGVRAGEEAGRVAGGADRRRRGRRGEADRRPRHGTTHPVRDRARVLRPHHRSRRTATGEMSPGRTHRNGFRCDRRPAIVHFRTTRAGGSRMATEATGTVHRRSLGAFCCAGGGRRRATRMAVMVGFFRADDRPTHPDIRSVQAALRLSSPDRYLRVLHRRQSDATLAGRCVPGSNRRFLGVREWDTDSSPTRTPKST